MNENHSKFEAKCLSDLIERRGKDGEYTSTFNARQFYDARLIQYWKKIALENDLFRENSDYKALYKSKCNNYNRLSKRCEDLMQKVESLTDSNILLRQTILKNKRK